MPPAVPPHDPSMTSSALPGSGALAAAHATRATSPIARLVAAKVGFPPHGLAGRDIPHVRMTPTAVHAAPTLRLVQEPHEAVTAENRRAAAISAVDARYALALRVADTLEGGTLAMLRPERRRQLVTQARRTGLRDFDTNLVIAIVQDAARHGEPMNAAAVTRRLSLVRPGHAAEHALLAESTDQPLSASAKRLAASRRWLEAVLVTLLAAAALAAMIRWIMRA